MGESERVSTLSSVRLLVLLGLEFVFPVDLVTCGVEGQ